VMYLDQRRDLIRRKIIIDEKEVFIKDIFLDDTQEKLTCKISFSNGTEILITEEQGEI